MELNKDDSVSRPGLPEDFWLGWNEKNRALGIRMQRELPPLIASVLNAGPSAVDDEQLDMVIATLDSMLTHLREATKAFECHLPVSAPSDSWEHYRKLQQMEKRFDGFRDKIVDERKKRNP